MAEIDISGPALLYVTEDGAVYRLDTNEGRDHRPEGVTGEPLLGMTRRHQAILYALAQHSLGYRF